MHTREEQGGPNVASKSSKVNDSIGPDRNRAIAYPATALSRITPQRRHAEHRSPALERMACDQERRRVPRLPPHAAKLVGAPVQPLGERPVAKRVGFGDLRQGA